MQWLETSQLFPVVFAEAIVSGFIAKVFNGRKVGSGPFPLGRAWWDRPVGSQLFPVGAVKDEVFNGFRLIAVVTQ